MTFSVRSRRNASTAARAAPRSVITSNGSTVDVIAVCAARESVVRRRAVQSSCEAEAAESHDRGLERGQRLRRGDGGPGRPAGRRAASSEEAGDHDHERGEPGGPGEHEALLREGGQAEATRAPVQLGPHRPEHAGNQVRRRIHVQRGLQERIEGLKPRVLLPPGLVLPDPAADLTRERGGPDSRPGSPESSRCAGHSWLVLLGGRGFRPVHAPTYEGTAGGVARHFCSILCLKWPRLVEFEGSGTPPVSREAVPRRKTGTRGLMGPVPPRRSPG